MLNTDIANCKLQYLTSVLGAQTQHVALAFFKFHRARQQLLHTFVRCAESDKEAPTQSSQAHQKLLHTFVRAK